MLPLMFAFFQTALEAVLFYGKLQLFKVRFIKKFIDYAKERHVDKIRNALQSRIDS